MKRTRPTTTGRNSTILTVDARRRRRHRAVSFLNVIRTRRARHSRSRRDSTTPRAPVAMSTEPASKAIALRGSTDHVVEFFGYAVNSVLYQRGVYPPESFERKSKYGIGVMVTSEPKLREYLVNVLERVDQWLMESDLRKLVLVLADARTGATVERWAFDVQTDGSKTRRDGENAGDANGEETMKTEKTEKEIMQEIQAIIRQITASVSFLPLLDRECAFELLAYTDKESATPDECEESDPKYVRDGVEMRLRSFSTKIHKIEAGVSYKTDDA